MVNRVLVTSLSAVLVSLLLVGLVSGTVVRHVIQVLPIALALWLAARHVRPASAAALPVFVIWLAIMTLIWLYVLGLARVVSGRFTTAEIALTIVIGIGCASGIAACGTLVRLERAWRQVAVAALFAALQIAAIWASILPAVAN
jgi:hypothetical protein